MDDLLANAAQSYEPRAVTSVTKNGISPKSSVPYRRPADTWQERLNLAMEDPGVVAGFSHTENFGACRRRERRSSYSDFHSMDG